MPMMQCYQYRVFDPIDCSDADETSKALTALGQQGWRFVSVLPSKNTDGALLFERVEHREIDHADWEGETP